MYPFSIIPEVLSGTQSEIEYFSNEILISEVAGSERWTKIDSNYSEKVSKIIGFDSPYGVSLGLSSIFIPDLRDNRVLNDKPKF